MQISEKSKYILMLAKASPKTHMLIEMCLNHYGYTNTQQISEKEVRDFCVLQGLIKE